MNENLGLAYPSTSHRWTVPEAPRDEDGSPGHAWVHVWEKEYGNPATAYVRVQVGKGGTALNAALFALGVTTGRALRAGVPPATVYRDLCGTTSEPYSEGGRLVYQATSAADALAQTLDLLYGARAARVRAEDPSEAEEAV